MEIQRPFAVVTPTLDGDVLAALIGVDAWMTTGQLHRVIAARSQQGIRLTLQRLNAQGIVESERVGQTMRYRLNREHLAAPAVMALANLRTQLLQRVEEKLDDWPVSPTYAAIFGSAGRGQMRTDSDIDIFVVRPGNVDGPLWDGQIGELARQVSRWTGNDGRILEMTEHEVVSGAHSDPVLRAIADEGTTVFGSPGWLRKYVKRKVVKHVSK